MKTRFAFYIIVLFLLVPILTSANSKGRFAPRVDTVSTAAQLDSIVSNSHDSINIFLLPGDYHLTYKCDIDTAIKVFNDETQIVPFTYGLRISAKYVRIKGSPLYGSAIYTHAGYGLFFVDCPNAIIEGVIVSGGRRDTSSNAPDAAIVLKNSKVKIIDNLIFENYGDTADLRHTKRGIMGICVREGSNAFIFNNQIAHNTWHGIGVFRDASATITGNLIDGVDRADADSVAGGSGTGILVTRNGHANIESNLIKRYTSGIGVFNKANANITNNLIEDITTWGMAVWDADTSKPIARIENNVIYKTGACGLSITRFLEGGESGYCKHNIFIENAQDRRFDSPDKYCYQCPLAVQGRVDNFVIENNTFYKNFWVAPCVSSLDEDSNGFINKLQSEYSSLPLQWYAGYSEFIQLYYLFVSK